MPPPRQPGGLVLFRVGPIEIAVHPSWLFTFVALTLVARAELVPSLIPGGGGWAGLAAIGIALLFNAFIVLHELSHALMARAHGLDARRITLFLFGGVAQIGAEAERPSHEFSIAVAGPLMSVFLAGVLAAISRSLHPAGEAMQGIWGRLAFVNLLLAVFNLVPAFPLDGGRILRAGLWGAFGDRVRATRWAATLGKAFAFALIGGGAAFVVAGLVQGGGASALPGVWYVVLGVFLFNVAGVAGRLEGGAEPRRLPGPDDATDEETRAAAPPPDYREGR